MSRGICDPGKPRHILFKHELGTIRVVEACRSSITLVNRVAALVCELIYFELSSKFGIEVTIAMKFLDLVRALAWSAVIALPVAVTSSTANANHQLGYHWARKTSPFTVILAKSVRPVWHRYIDVAAADWSRSSRFDIKLRQGTFDPRSCNPASGRIRVCSARYGDNGWLGLTQIWRTGDHIIQATSKLNDTYFVTERFNTNRWRQLSVCHEIGHTFGLSHQDENVRNSNLGTCLDLTSKPRTNQHPNQHDFDQLWAIYRHTDKSTTVKDAAGKTSLQATSAWGRAIHVDGQGRGHVFVRALGGGQELVTIVTWAGE